MVQSQVPPSAGTLDLATWLDSSVVGKLEVAPEVVADFGSVSQTFALGEGNEVKWAFHYDARCEGGELLPRRVNIKVRFKVTADGLWKFEGTLPLDIQPDGTLTVGHAKASFFEGVPLERRYGGVIERSGRLLRARLPHGVEARDARWYADGIPLRETADPLVVEADGDASVVCVVKVDGGVAVAHYGPARS
jgi:hypothetical protein